jgi:fumarate hydratase subunit beta
MLNKVKVPLTEESIRDLHAGDSVLLTGILYVARDAAHKKMVESLDQGQPLPFDIRGQTIYYMGPSPARPGQVIGAAGPTTSGRMDIYTPRLLQAGLKGMIGKGNLSRSVREALIKFYAVYFAAIGGAGALIAQSIRKSELVAYEELGAEAVRKLEVEDFSVTVIDDIYGNDLYEEGKSRYRHSKIPN